MPNHARSLRLQTDSSVRKLNLTASPTKSAPTAHPRPKLTAHNRSSLQITNWQSHNKLMYCREGAWGRGRCNFVVRVECLSHCSQLLDAGQVAYTALSALTAFQNQ